MPQLISESVSLSAAPAAKSGRIRIKIIDAGQGSSGNYPASTIEAAVKDKVFAKGLHMYADHPGVTENFDRPERTIKDLAAVLETDAEWVPEESAAYAEARVFPHWREVISEMAADIGVSIRASAEVEDGKGGRTITKLLYAESVDFVTKAGRGGKIAEVLESARQVIEATANDTREWLQAAIKSTSDGYSYVRDFDDSNVWYASWADDTERLYQQGYTLNGNTATLTGDPIEVRVETSYVPITPATEAAQDVPSNLAGSTETKESKEIPMAKIEVDEAAHTAAVEASGRVPALEAENADLKAKLAEAAKKDNDATAAAVVAEAFQGISAPATVKLLASTYSLTPDGTVDTVALKAKADESAAGRAVSFGASTVRGLGDKPVTESKTITDDDVVNAL